MSKINVKVITLESELDFSVESSCTGKQLFDQVLKHLSIRESWFFGLQYIDSKNDPQWLIYNKKITSQGVPKPYILTLCVKFYPEDVEEELIVEPTQRMFYLQVRNDILCGDIFVPDETSVLLASYACQVKYGDFQTNLLENENEGLYKDHLLPERVVEKHSLSKAEWVSKIVHMYREHRDMLREDAMMEYLKVAQDLEMYGVSYFNITNKKGTALVLGLDALGVNIYNQSDKLTPIIGFPWSEIRRISYRNKKFTIKSVDKTSANFHFFTHDSNINKRILILSMGNHELYMRRRKPDSIEVQQMKAQAREEKQAKRTVRENLKRERDERLRVEAELMHALNELKMSRDSSENNRQQMEVQKMKIAELESSLEESHRQKLELEEFQRRLEENNRLLEEAQRQQSDDYQNLLTEKYQIEAEIRLKQEETMRTNAQLEERSAELERISREKEEAEERARQLEELRQQAEEALANDNKNFESDLAVLNG